MRPDSPSSPVARTRPGTRLRQAAWLILVVGLLAAAAVWLAADADAERDPGAYRIVGGQAFAVDDALAADRQTERLGGRALVQTAALDRWLGSLWHGRRLAVTLGALSVALALACFWIAGPAGAPTPTDRE